MLIYVMRHGETKANEEGMLQGTLDYPLNELGVKLARETGRGMAKEGIHFTACISSPLIRAVQTAQLVLKESGNENTPLIFDKRIAEVDMGEWEGLKIRGDLGELEKRAQEFIRDPLKYPGSQKGENAEDVCRRTQAFLRELMEKDDEGTYLVTMHGFALRAMLRMFYDQDEDFWHGHIPYNCVVNVVEVSNGQAKLIKDDIIYYDPDMCVDRY